jgi:EAL domain-containing protein (putative c-di-GMP-specific phosphodiesterase class I)
LGEAGIVCPRISVNLSGSEFNEDTATRIQSVLEQYEINPGALTIEITENAKINASATAFDNLKELRRRGLRLSIDDFGTGYSSLAYLSELDVDEIKIDKSFIQSATTSARHKSIVQAILGICSVFGYAVVAEGVETKDQAELLSNQADATLQGFWLGVPCSLDAIGLRGSSCAHRPDGLSMRQWPDASGQTPNQTACF